jgi:hypothetical protein
LPNILKSKLILILFADDISIIVKDPNHIEYENELTLLLKIINEWFKANLLTLNLDKTCFVQFSTKNSSIMNMPFICSNNHITSSTDIKFLGLVIDGTLSWKWHIDRLMSKLDSASYAVRATHHMKPWVWSIFHIFTLLWPMVWFFGVTRLRLQKRLIRIITNFGSRDSCRELFKKLKFCPLYSQYILSLLLFVVKNNDLFLSNSESHTINTTNSNNLHYPSCNLTVFQKGTNYFCVK